MTNFITLAKAILLLFPAIIAAVQALEGALPQSGQGAAKLEAIKKILEAAYSAAGETMHTFEQIWPMLSGAVGTIVTLFNGAGLFNKGKN
jgi:hypothetical protein